MPDRALLLTMTIAIVLGAVGVTAAAATPMGEYAVFAECPVNNTEISGCLASQITGGEITIGHVTVPITSTQTLQGGLINESLGAIRFVAAAGGNTLSKTPQTVPGGLLGAMKCAEIKSVLKRLVCKLAFENSATTVRATTELAAPAGSIGLNEYLLFSGIAPGLQLPVKIKLENPLLGNECYIGSNSHPILLNLTTGTTNPPAPNKPIAGNPGKVTSRAEGGVLVVSGNSLVDNAFAAPEATGCAGPLAFLVDPILNTKLGLPSPAGQNTAILNGTIEQASAELVKESE